MSGKSSKGESYQLPSLSNSNVIIGVKFEWNGGAVIIEGKGEVTATAIEGFKRTANGADAIATSDLTRPSRVDGDKGKTEPNNATE